MKHGLRHTARAQIRDATVLFCESRYSLGLFTIVVLGGALVFRFLYTHPVTGQNPALSEALYAVFALVFFDTVLPFPHEWYLQVLFFIIPVLGLAALADGVIRFGSALMNKQARGKEWQQPTVVTSLSAAWEG